MMSGSLYGGWPGLADGYEADRAPNSVSVLLYFVAAWVPDEGTMSDCKQAPQAQISIR